MIWFDELSIPKKPWASQIGGASFWAFLAQEILGGTSNSFGASWIRRNIVLGAQRSEKFEQTVANREV